MLVKFFRFACCLYGPPRIQQHSLFFFQPTKTPNFVQVWFSENYGSETSGKRPAKKVFREAFSPPGSFSLLEVGCGKSVAFQKPNRPAAE